MSHLPLITRIAAGLGGLLWITKVAVIAARDGSFDPLESVLFIGGLLLVVTAAGLVAFQLAGRFRPVVRVLATIAGTVALVAASMLLEGTGKGVIAAVAPGDNLGFEQEGGILVCGLAWLVYSLRPKTVSPPATPSPRPVLDNAS